MNSLEDRLEDRLEVALLTHGAAISGSSAPREAVDARLRLRRRRRVQRAVTASTISAAAMLGGAIALSDRIQVDEVQDVDRSTAEGIVVAGELTFDAARGETPPGREIGLRLTEPPEGVLVRKAAPGTVRTLLADGLSPATVFLSATAGPDMAFETQCVADRSVTECHGQPDLGSTYVHSYRAQSQSSLIVVSLPEAVEFVSYRFEGEDLWQRPIAGDAYLPTGGYKHPVAEVRTMKFFDAQGHAVTFGASPGGPIVFAKLDPEVFAAATRSHEDALGAAIQAFDESLNGCLRQSGADPGTGAYGGADPESVWDSCVKEATEGLRQDWAYIENDITAARTVPTNP